MSGNGEVFWPLAFAEPIPVHGQFEGPVAAVLDTPVVADDVEPCDVAADRGLANPDPPPLCNPYALIPRGQMRCLCENLFERGRENR